MSSAYRPAAVGRILDRALGLYRANWQPIMVAALILLFPAALLASLGQVFAQRELIATFSAAVSGDVERLVAAGRDIQANQWVNLLGTAAVWLYTAVRLWMTVAIITVAPKLVAGQRVNVRELLAAPASRFWVALAVTVISGLVSIVPVLGWIVLVFWTLLVPIVVVEDTSFEKAFGRSWKLVAAVGFWRTVLFLLGVLLVTTVLQLVPTAPMILRQMLDWIRDTGSLFQPLSVEWTVIQGVLTALGWALAAPFAPLATYLYYADARSRAEGMDLVLRARELESVA